jgi:hypothetical protein
MAPIENNRDHSSRSSASTQFFSDHEKDQVAARIEGTRNDLPNKAVRFRNSLQAFLRDVERAQSATPPSLVLAIDSTEVYALVRSGQPSIVGFSFDGLLQDASIRLEKRIEVLDRMISNRLFRSDDRQLLVLDPFASEINTLEQLLFGLEERALRSVPPITLSLPIAAFENMRQWLQTKRNNAEFQAEWTKFREQMIPNWGDDLISSLVRAPGQLLALQEFKRDGRYSFLRSESFGRRAFSKLLPESVRGQFDFAAFESFSNSDQAVARAKEIYDVSYDAFLGLGRGNRTAELIRASSARDAQAFATIDLVNCFLEASRVNARVELVTRSAAMHDVMAAMPLGKLRVTLRHPLFLADIYRFDRETIHTIGEHLQTIDGLLEPVVELKSLVVRDQKLRESAVQIFLLLESMIIAQHTIERKADLESASNRSDENILLIETVFKTLISGVKDRSDPFAKELNVKAIDRVLSISKAAIDEGDTTTPGYVRAIRIGRSSPGTAKKQCTAISPLDFLAVRLVGGSYSRLIHLHSRRAQKAFGVNVDSLETHSESPLVPFQIEIDRHKLVANITEALEKLKRSPVLDGAPTAEEDDFRFIVDSTLMLGMVFAGERKFSLASMLASVVLHPMVMQLRMRGEAQRGPNYLGRFLSFRELFLFRHYCERALAVSDYFGDSRRFGGAKGSVPKSLARAQRDIDFAALMSEEAELCANGPNEKTIISGASSAGQLTVLDGRLRLAHFGSILDQFIFTLEEDRGIRASLPRSFRSDVPSIRGRLDTWVMAGLVKELANDAFVARSFRQSMSSDPKNRCNAQERYFAHLEARCLQSLLQTFVVFMSYEISPPLHRMWTSEPILDPERLLVFRDWANWWERYRVLKKEYAFTMRSYDLIELACVKLISIQSLALQARNMGVLEATDVSRRTLLHVEKDLESCIALGRSLRSQCGDNNGFVYRVAGRMIERLEEILAQEIRPKIKDL